MKKVLLIFILIFMSCDQTKDVKKALPEVISYEIEANDLFDIDGGRLKGEFSPVSQTARKVLSSNYPSVHYASLKVLGQITLRDGKQKTQALNLIAESISASSKIKFGKFMDSSTQDIKPNSFILCISENIAMTLMLTQAEEHNKYHLSATFAYFKKWKRLGIVLMSLF